MSDRDFKAVTSALEGHTEKNLPIGVLTAMTAEIAGSNFAALPAYFTEDVHLTISGFPGLDGSWNGRDAVVGAMEMNFNKISGQKTVTESFMSQADAIAMLIRDTGYFKPDGREYCAQGVIWFQFEGGKIKRVEEFLRRER